MSGASKVRIRVRFVGRVQGVGFRATCRWIASSHPVTGWVRNEEDGSVVLEVQGGHEGVEAFLQDVSGRLAQNIRSQERMVAGLEPGERAFVIAR